MPPTMSSIPGTQSSPAGLMGTDPSQGAAPGMQGPQQMPGPTGGAIDQQAGLFQSLQDLHQGVIMGREILLAIAQQFPATAEPVRAIMQALDGVAQGLPALVTAMTSQAQEPYTPSPMVLG